MLFRTLNLVIVLAAAAVLASPAQAQRYKAQGDGLVNESAYALQENHWESAVGYARRALSSGGLLPSNFAAAHNNLCVGFIGLGRLEEAMAACDKAVEMMPRQWSFYNNRANVYWHMGQYDRALAEYYKAMTFSPGDDVLLRNIEITLMKQKAAAQPSG